MTLLYTSIRTPYEAVTEVKAIAERRGFHPPRYKVNCLAYNPHHEASDTWWISPTGENPAYRFPKIAFSPASGPIKTAHLFVGLNIEKGLTGRAASAFRTYPERCRRWMMEEGWAWHQLVQKLHSGEFVEDLERAAKRAGQSCQVILKASEVVCREDRSERDRHNFKVHTGDQHELQFSFRDGKLITVHDEASPPKPGLFRGTTRAEHFSDLPRLVESISGPQGNDQAWHWVDFYVGHHFNLAHPADRPGTWRAEDLWERICLAWDSWLWP